MISKKYFLFITLLIVIAVSFVFIWIANTNAGARFVINRMTRYVPGDIRLDEIKGTLAGDLKLEGFKMRSTDLEISVNHIHVRWKPLSLFGGWLHIGQLHLEQVKINDLHPEVINPYDLTWPRVPAILSWFKARIKSLHVTGLTYGEAGHEVLFIDQFKAQAVWYLGTLSVKEILIVGPLGSFHGMLGANFVNPRLSLQVRLLPHEVLYGLKEHYIDLQLKEDRKQRHMGGSLTVIAMSGDREMAKLATSVSIARGVITLDRLELREMGRPGTLTGRISLDLSNAKRPFEVNVVVADLGLTKKSGSTKTFSGTLKVNGDFKGYQGLLKMQTKGKKWEEIAADASFEGDYEGIQALRLKGKYLGGTIHGDIRASWVKGFLVSGAVEVKDLNPALITPDWPGKINAKVQGDFDWSTELPKGTVKLRLLESVVRNRPLTGYVDAQWAKDSLILEHGELKGNGFELSARGILHEKINYKARVTDIGGIIPQGSGRFSATGWVKRSRDRWAGVLRAEGSAIKIDGFSADSATIDANLGDSEEDNIHGTIQAKNVKKNTLDLGAVGLNIEGKVSNHEIRASLSWPKAVITVLARGAYQEGKWSGTVYKIEGSDEYAGEFKAVKPISLMISTEKARLTPLMLTNGLGEIVELDGEFVFEPLQGHFNARWEKVNLARANTILTMGKIEGTSSGSLRANILQNNLLKLNGSSSATLIFSKDKASFRMMPTIKIDSDEGGLRIAGQVNIEGAGKVEGQFYSTEQATIKIPSSGLLKLTWNDVDIASINQWLPRTLNVRGKFSGNITGRLASGNHFDISGDTRASGASLSLRGEGGFVRSAADKVNLDFTWNDSGLQGNIDLRFAGNGRLQGKFGLPVPAHFPIAPDKRGPVNIVAKGEISEMGMVNAIFPGVVEETAGRLVFDVSQTGTWEKPQRIGRARLENASAYLPASGIRMKDISMDISFADDVIELESFIVHSGPGRLNGKGTIFLKDWSITSFKAHLKGERFQVVNLPELQLLANPDMTFEGTGKKIVIRGTVMLPEGFARDRQGREVIRASEDVIMMDKPRKASTPMQTTIDTELSVVFGDKVRIAVEGLEGRLAGRVLLTGQGSDRIFGRGTIRIVNGRFDSYGLKLDVTRGNIVLDDGPIERTSLDIMAIKTFNPGSFDQVRAGVTVTGLALQPLIKLYSEPSMADSDILSYLLFGRPLRVGGEPGQTAILMKSAGVLLGGSRGAGLQEQIQQRLGLDTLEVTEGPSSIYASSRTTNGGLERSLVTVGKYLSPRLYVAYGRSVFSDEYLLSARYSLGKRVEVETRTGMESSIDLYYKIEFF